MVSLTISRRVFVCLSRLGRMIMVVIPYALFVRCRLRVAGGWLYFVIGPWSLVIYHWSVVRRPSSVARCKLRGAGCVLSNESQVISHKKFLFQVTRYLSLFTRCMSCVAIGAVSNQLTAIIHYDSRITDNDSTLTFLSSRISCLNLFSPCGF